MNEQKAMQAYKALRAMESAADLKKAGFTLSDYREAQDCLQEYARNNGEDGTATISKDDGAYESNHVSYTIEETEVQA